MNEMGELFVRMHEAEVDRVTARNIAMRIRRPAHLEEMLNWIRQYPEATPQEILDKSREIAKKRVP